MPAVATRRAPKTLRSVTKEVVVEINLDDIDEEDIIVFAHQRGLANDIIDHMTPAERASTIEHCLEETEGCAAERIDAMLDVIRPALTDSILGPMLWARLQEAAKAAGVAK